MRSCCMSTNTGGVIEKAERLIEAWVHLRNYFNGQRLQLEIENILVQVLKTKRPENNQEAIAYYRS
jgi:hypothetical protein